MSFITLSDDVLINIISFLCIYDVWGSSGTCRVLYDIVKKHKLFRGALTRYPVSLPFDAVRYCENQNVYRYADENVLRALRPFPNKVLQGEFCFKLQDDGVVHVSLRLADFQMRDLYVFNLATFMNYVPRKTITRPDYFAQMRLSESNEVEFWPYGYYLRVRFRHNSQSFLLATKYYGYEAAIGELSINPFKEMNSKMRKVGAMYYAAYMKSSS